MEIKNLPRFCVLVGANGTGKSTLFQLFGFLKDVFQTNLPTAFVKLGGSKGIQEVRSRGQKGNIEIELKFREKPTDPLVIYFLSIGEKDGFPIVDREILEYRRGSSRHPRHLLDFKRGKGYAVTNELENVKNVESLNRSEELILKSQDILAIKGLAQFERFPAAKALGDLIENWHISDFHITKARPEQESGNAEHLSTEGENLSLVTEYLSKNHPDVFNALLERLTKRVPGLARVDSKTTEEGRVLLRFKDGAFEDPFLARHVSDGTIKMFAYLILLYDPKPYPLLCVEEPENQLYPKLLWELAEEFRAYSLRGKQVFVSTHSPDFLNAVNIDEVLLLIKQGGYTQIKRAGDDDQIKSMMAAGDQMGFLWKQGFFEKVDP